MAYIRRLTIQKASIILRQRNGYCSISWHFESTRRIQKNIHKQWHTQNHQDTKDQLISQSKPQINIDLNRLLHSTKQSNKWESAQSGSVVTRTLYDRNGYIINTAGRLNHVKINYQRYYSKIFHTACFKKKILESQKSTSKQCYCNDSSNSDSDSEDIKLVLSVVGPKPTKEHVHIVPGKGPPPEPPVDCCMSGCANCVWIQYAEDLKEYFTAEQGMQKAKEAIEEIENPGLKMFLKLELGLL